MASKTSSPDHCRTILPWQASLLPQVHSRLSFIGNPGLLNFYIPFLESLYARDTTSSLAIFACSHIGHTPGIEAENALPTFRYGLPAQIEGSIEAFDAVQSTFSAGTKIVVVGHSVGSWLSLQVLKARPSAVAGAFMLFPTISHIRDTPNGRMLFVRLHSLPHDMFFMLTPVASPGSDEKLRFLAFLPHSDSAPDCLGSFVPFMALVTSVGTANALVLSF